jgi:hypothetical protein
VAEKWTHLGNGKDRELWKWEKQRPDGDWETLYRGKIFIRLPDGTVKQTPDDPFFKTEDEGCSWLMNE